LKNGNKKNTKADYIYNFKNKIKKILTHNIIEKKFIFLLKILFTFRILDLEAEKK